MSDISNGFLGAFVVGVLAWFLFFRDKSTPQENGPGLWSKTKGAVGNSSDPLFKAVGAVGDSGGTVIIICLLIAFFYLTLFSNINLNPTHIYEWTMVKVVGVTGIFILCGAAWYGFPSNNKIRFLGVFVGGTLLTAIFFGWWNAPSADTLPVNSLRVSAYSDSVRVPVRAGYGLAWSGDSFSVHCVYSDGRPEVVIEDLSRSCDKGPLLSEYVHNNSAKTQIYTHKDVR